MKQNHIEVLREMQAICEEKVKGGCSESCPFFDGSHCLLIVIPKFWELDEFKVEG